MFDKTVRGENLRFTVPEAEAAKARSLARELPFSLAPGGEYFLTINGSESEISSPKGIDFFSVTNPGKIKAMGVRGNSTVIQLNSAVSSVTTIIVVQSPKAMGSGVHVGPGNLDASSRETLRDLLEKEYLSDDELEKLRSAARKISETSSSKKVSTSYESNKSESRTSSKSWEPEASGESRWP